jgi:N-acetylneuraminic acid mutarotase
LILVSSIRIGGKAITKQTQLLAVLLIALAILPVAATQTFAEADTANTDTSSWISLMPMPTARGSFGLAAVGGKIYVLGGINSDNQPLNVVEEYNPNINEWTIKQSMPTARSGCAVAVYNGKIYVFGGTVGGGFSGNNEVYDPQSNTWASKASMPTARADLCANVVNDGIYLIGGKKYASNNPFYEETNVNEVYFPENNTWSTKASLPNPVQGYASTVTENKIYVVGGSMKPTIPGTTSLVNSNQIYNAVQDSWSSGASLPLVSSYGAAAATTGYSAPPAVYYLGGFSSDAYSKTTQVFNLNNNTWKDVDPMPTARGYLGVATVNDMLYAIGGFDGANWLTTVERYTPLGYGTVPPQIEITSPENRTYREVTLTYTINRGVEWLGYSLDGKQNVSLASATKLIDLTQGSHQIVMYANDSAGNMGVSNSVSFSVDSVAPRVVILSPTNQSYGQNDVQLTFLVNEETSALEYSLDGYSNIPIIGNVTLVALSNGEHKLTVFAADKIGNVEEVTVYFEVSPFPTLLVIAALVIVIIVIALGYILFKLRKQPKKSNPTKPVTANMPKSPPTPS